MSCPDGMLDDANIPSNCRISKEVLEGRCVQRMKSPLVYVRPGGDLHELVGVELSPERLIAVI
jgi:hypothetical protein